MTHPALAIVGRYVGLFWRNCPQQALDLLIDQVIPGALRDPSPNATDAILRHAPEWSWYRDQPIAVRKRFHKLAGHCVRAAREYVPVRQEKSKFGPHRTFTVQDSPDHIRRARRGAFLNC
jgi:hypothetical protein